MLSLILKGKVGSRHWGLKHTFGDVLPRKEQSLHKDYVYARVSL